MWVFGKSEAMFCEGVLARLSLPASELEGWVLMTTSNNWLFAQMLIIYTPMTLTLGLSTFPSQQSSIQQVRHIKQTCCFLAHRFSVRRVWFSSMLVLIEMVGRGVKQSRKSYIDWPGKLSLDGLFCLSTNVAPASCGLSFMKSLKWQIWLFIKLSTTIIWEYFVQQAFAIRQILEVYQKTGVI